MSDSLAKLAERLHEILDKYPKAQVPAKEQRDSWLADTSISKTEANRLSRIYGLSHKGICGPDGEVYYQFYRPNVLWKIELVPLRGKNLMVTREDIESYEPLPWEKVTLVKGCDLTYAIDRAKRVIYISQEENRKHGVDKGKTK